MAKFKHYKTHFEKFEVWFSQGSLKKTKKKKPLKTGHLVRFL